MWDMTIGMGADPIVTFGVGNVSCAWIYSFIPVGISEYVFNAITIFRMYLSGLMFALYAYCRRNSINSSVAGALVYAFSATVYVSFTQPPFAYLFYVFPLMMIGVERVWNGKGFKIYVISMMISVMFSYYFTYMMVILIVVYCIVRFACESEGRSILKLGRLLGRFIPFTLLGLGMGVVFQLPSMINISETDRLGVAPVIPAFSFSGIKELFLHCFSNGEVGHEGFWGISSIALLCIILLFRERGKYTAAKIMLILYTLSFAFPVVGSVFNGFSTPTGRYVFGYLMLVSYIVVLEYDRLSFLGSRVLYIILAASGVYMVIVFALGDAVGMMSALSLIMMTALVYFSDRFFGKNKRKMNICRYAGIFISCLIIGFAHIHVYILAAEVDLGDANNILMGNSGVFALNDEQLTDLQNTRMDFIPFSFDDSPSNSSMVLDVNSYDYYHSNYNNNVDHYYDKLGIISDPMGYRYTGLRGRDYLELMNATQYIVRDTHNDMIISAPYSYNLISDTNNRQVLGSSRDVSMVYFYDNAVSDTCISDLDSIATEDIMMETCFLETVQEDALPDLEYSSINYSLLDSNGITQAGDNAFHAESGSYMILGFDELQNSEISLFFDHMNSDVYYVVTASVGYGDKEFSYEFFSGKSPDDRYYHWKDDFVVNFGYYDVPVDHVKILFNSAGDYTVDQIKLYARSKEQLDKTINAFYDHAGIEDLSYEINGNHILINALADKDKYLYLAVPYSSGWSATIDGESVKILKANIAFMAIPISEGAHTVEFTYCTPFLKESMCISGVFWGVFVILCLTAQRQRRKNETKS